MSDLISVAAPPTFFDGVDPAATLSADDRLAMMALTSRFEWAFDARRLDALEALLTEDVVIDHLFGLADNRDATMRMLREVVPFKGIRHQATNAACFVDAVGRPCVLSFLMVVQVADDSHRADSLLPRILAHAVVTDVMRRTDRGWRIAARTFEQMRLRHDYAPNDDAWTSAADTVAKRRQREQSKEQTT